MSNFLSNLFGGLEANETPHITPKLEESHCNQEESQSTQGNDDTPMLEIQQDVADAPQVENPIEAIDDQNETEKQDAKSSCQMSITTQHELHENISTQIKEIVSPITANIASLHQLISEMSAMFQQQSSSNQNILHSLQEKVENVVETQENTIQKQHNAALKFQEDVIYKTQKNLIMELIGIADNIRMIIQNSEVDAAYDLLGAVKDLGNWVDASLANNSVRKFYDTNLDSTTMNRKRQQLVDKEETDIEAEHNTYKTVAPGYEWSVPYLVVNSEVQLTKILEENSSPQLFSYVIRPEEIVKLEYKDNTK